MKVKKFKKIMRQVIEEAKGENVFMIVPGTTPGEAMVGGNLTQPEALAVIRTIMARFNLTPIHVVLAFHAVPVEQVTHAHGMEYRQHGEIPDLDDDLPTGDVTRKADEKTKA